MNQLMSEWSKQLAAWMKRQPRWMVVSGGLLVLVLGGLLLANLQSSGAEPAIPGTVSDSAANPTALVLGVFARLMLVVAAIYIGAMLLRRWQSGGAKAAVRQLALLETLHLTQRRTVYLVRAGEQVFLLGASDQSITLLGQVTPTAEGRPSSAKISFDQQLSIASQKTTDNFGEE